jgi:hypothetical protein
MSQCQVRFFEVNMAKNDISSLLDNIDTQVHLLELKQEVMEEPKEIIERPVLTRATSEVNHMGLFLQRGELPQRPYTPSVLQSVKKNKGRDALSKSSGTKVSVLLHCNRRRVQVLVQKQAQKRKSLFTNVASWLYQRD